MPQQLPGEAAVVLLQLGGQSPRLPPCLPPVLPGRGRTDAGEACHVELCDGDRATRCSSSTTPESGPQKPAPELRWQQDATVHAVKWQGSRNASITQVTRAQQ